MSKEPGRWKRWATYTHEGPLPEVGAELSGMLDAWADQAGRERIYRMELVGDDQARLVTAELIPLNDPDGVEYLQLVRNCVIWVNLDDPDHPEDGGALDDYGRVAYYEVYLDPRTDLDTTREFLEDHPAPPDPALYGYPL